MSEKLDSILQHVEPARRTFLKRMFAGSALALIALPASSVLAEPQNPGDGKGKKGKKGKKGGGKKGGKKG